MKNAAFVVLFIPLLQFFSSCSGDVENKTSLDSDSLYTVYKIDSIDNFYLVYASMQGMKYKIISEKASCGTSNEIKLNESYRLKLTSR